MPWIFLENVFTYLFSLVLPILCATKSSWFEIVVLFSDLMYQKWACSDRSDQIMVCSDCVGQKVFWDCVDWRNPVLDSVNRISSDLRRVSQENLNSNLVDQKKHGSKQCGPKKFKLIPCEPKKSGFRQCGPKESSFRQVGPTKSGFRPCGKKFEFRPCGPNESGFRPRASKKPIFRPCDPKGFRTRHCDPFSPT